MEYKKYNSSLLNDQLSIEQIAEIGRNNLTRRKDKNTFDCPDCNGKLWIATNNRKITCLSNGCKGIFKAILQQAGEWQDWGNYYNNDEARREREYQKYQQAKQAKVNKKVIPAVDLNLVPGEGLTDSHYQEFLASGISKESADLNFHGISDNSLIAKYLGWKAYQHTGGWVNLGLNLVTGKPSLLGQFKPDQPYQFPDKPAKYLTSKAGYDAIAPVSNNIDWQAVINDPSEPIAITEGGKKAVSLADNLGVACLAIPGVEMWKKPGDSDTIELVDNLALLAVPNRPINLYWDSDWREKTQVASALQRCGETLTAGGCVVTVAVWDEQYKGIDDYLASGGRDIDYIPFGEWVEWQKKVIRLADKSTIEIQPTVLEYAGNILNISDRFNLPAPLITIPQVFDKDHLLSQINHYRDLASRRFSRLPMDDLRAIAKENNIKQSLDKTEAIEKLATLTGLPADNFQNMSLQELKQQAKLHDIKNLFGINQDELAERLEQANIDKSGIKFDDKLTLTIRVNHPSGSFIANLLESQNDFDQKPKFKILLPFELLKSDQFLDHRKVRRNDPEVMKSDPAFEYWKRMKKFTPDHVTKVKYLGQSELLQNINIADKNIHVIKGGLGTGKTVFMIDKVKIIDDQSSQKFIEKISQLDQQYPNHHIVIVGYRNGLNLNIIAKMQEAGINMMTAKDFKKNYDYVKRGKHIRVAGCIDSFLEIDQRLPKGWEKETIFIFDEVDSVVNHTLIGSTIKDRRSPIITRLNDCLKECSGILALSGTVNDTCLRFFDDLGKKTIKYENIIDRPKIPLRWVIGSSRDAKADVLEIKEKDNVKIIDNIVAKITAGENIIISSDSQKACERLHEYLKNVFDDQLNIIRIDQKSRCKNESKDLVNQVLKTPQILPAIGCQVLIYNSSAESGVDISFDEQNHNYFSHQFHFGYDVVSCDSTIQMLRRHRHGCPVTVWMTPTALYKQPLLGKDDLRFNQRIKLIEAGLNRKSQPDSKFLALRDDLDFMLTYERQNPRQCLLHLLGEHGYDIEYICNDESPTSLSAENELIETRYANEIFTADPKYIGDDLSLIKLDDDSDWDSQLALKKAHYFNNFGYTKDDFEAGNFPLFSEENIREIEFTNRKFFDNVRNLTYVKLSKDDLKILQRNRYKDSGVFIGDIKPLITPMDAIAKSGLSQLLSLTEINIADPLFKQIEKYATSHPRRWHELAGDKYSDKYKYSQIQSILKKYFGIIMKKSKDIFTITRPELLDLALPRIENKILERLEKLKTPQEPKPVDITDYEYDDYGVIEQAKPPDKPIEISPPAVVTVPLDQSAKSDQSLEDPYLDLVQIPDDLVLTANFKYLTPYPFTIDRNTKVIYQGESYEFCEYKGGGEIIDFAHNDKRVSIWSKQRSARKWTVLVYGS